MILIFSIIFNFISSIVIIGREISHNEEFYKWFKKNTTILAALTVISSTEVDALLISTSRIGGLMSLNAPLSPKAHSLIFWCSLMGFVIEDIPQFIIQVSHT